MTAGHKHRTLHLSPTSPILHLLRTPLMTHRDADAAEQSRWTWAEVTIPACPGDLGGRQFTLTPLGILHTLTGLTIDTSPKARL